jgi:predicted nucleic acid-binding protein
MSTRITLDTNVFIYALDARDPGKQSSAIALIQGLRGKDCAISLQVCSETYAALTRKLKRAPWEAAQAARNVLALFPVFSTSRPAVERALAEAAAGRFQYWDALLLATAHESSCDVCFSEDMADGTKLGRIEVATPFAPDGSLSARAHRAIA